MCSTDAEESDASVAGSVPRTLPWCCFVLTHHGNNSNDSLWKCCLRFSCWNSLSAIRDKVPPHPLTCNLIASPQCARCPWQSVIGVRDSFVTRSMLCTAQFAEFSTHCSHLQAIGVIHLTVFVAYPKLGSCVWHYNLIIDRPQLSWHDIAANRCFLTSYDMIWITIWLTCDTIDGSLHNVWTLFV